MLEKVEWRSNHSSIAQAINNLWNITMQFWKKLNQDPTINQLYRRLITCVIARFNPRRLFLFFASSNVGHYQGTMTSYNDRVCDVTSAKCFPLKRHTNECTSTKRFSHCVVIVYAWTEQNSLTRMGIRRVRNNLLKITPKPKMFRDNNNFAISTLQPLCEFVRNYFESQCFLWGAILPQKIPQSKITSEFTQWPQKRWCSY